LRAAVRALDGLLRRLFGIREFSRSADCLLRLSVVRSRRDLTLADGTVVRPGDRVGDLHLWNERMPPLPREWPDLRWALGFQRRLKRSLEELADAVASDPAYADLAAFRAVGSAMTRHGALPALAERLGFELVEDPHAGGLWRRFASFWENVYSLALVWVYNPASLRSKELRGLRRVQLWISRGELERRYGRCGAAR